jgi:peptidoglycan hydrolase-like protein with peptidoglycan-binding domain
MVLLGAGAGLVLLAMLAGPSGGPTDTPPAAVATTRVIRTNLEATQRVDGTLGYAPAAPVVDQRPGTFTWLPTEGAQVSVGQTLFAVDNQPTALLVGTMPAWRAFSLGMSDGPDVQELENNLKALGYDPDSTITVDDHFSIATSAAVERFQVAVNQPPTGTLDLGGVAFEPSPIRVGALSHQVGESAQPGLAPYAVTSTNRVVTVELDASRQRAVTGGLAVTIDLLDGHSTPGTITSVGRVASSPSAANNGPSSPTVEVLVTPSDAAAVGDFDQAPAQIEFVTESRQHVLAVPIAALLSLPGDRTGLETIDAQGHHHLTFITTGLFTESMVEVRGSTITDGTTIVTAG